MTRKGIKTNPKTARQFKSTFNKVLWRKYRLVRADTSVSLEDLASAFENGVSAFTVASDAAKAVA